MDPKICKKTQETLGKIIKKPPLTDKLLSKPPFRFLHDILTEVIRTTGFFKGLYTSDEMNSANVKDKDSKIAFLQKAIDVTVMVMGESLSVRPSKVVAGHEPEKTNEFLQAIAKAIQSKTDCAEAVQKVLSGEKPGSASKSSKKKESKSSKEKDGTSKDNEDKESSGQKDRDKKREDESSKRKEKREDRESSGDRRKREGMGSRERKESRGRERSKDRERSRDKEKDRERERNKENERHSEKERHGEKQRKKEKEDESDTIDTGGTAALIDGDAEMDNGSSVNRLPRPSSAKGQRRRPHNAESEGPQQDEDDGDENVESGAVREDKVDSSQINGPDPADDLPPQVASRKLVRPSSARPAPPKIRKQEEEQEPIDRIGSGKQVANVIVDDGKDQDEDEDDTFVVDNTPAAHETGVVDSTEPVEDDGEHGALVKKMLETKKELEGTGAASKNEPERPVVLNAARRKEKELVEKEIEKLRASIQTLCRSANPLGKIMDYIQEDMDSMNKELEMWRKENKEYTIRLKQEESKTQSDIEPLKGKLEEQEAEITEMVDKISTVKCNISRNDEKIRQMLSSLSFSTR